MSEKTIYQSHSEKVYDFIEKEELLVEKILTTNDSFLEEGEISELKSISSRLQEIRLNLYVSPTEIKESEGSKKDHLAEEYCAEIDIVSKTLCYFVYKIIDEFCSILERLVDDAKSAWIDLSSLIIERSEYDYNGILNQFIFAEPILLTNEELYYALTFLNDEQVRIVLSEQTNKNFNKILSAYNKDYDNFLSVLEDLDFDRSKGIRFILCASINKVFPIENYIQPNVKIETSIGNTLADEMFGDGTSEMLLGIKSSAFKNESINDLHYIFDSFYELESKVEPTLSRYISLLYDQGNEEFREDDNFDFYAGDSHRVNKLVFCIIDKWIRWAIHERMKEDTIASKSNEQENILNDYVSSKLDPLSFPFRIGKEILDKDKRISFLRKLYATYGHCLNHYNGHSISEDEFVYLFSGGISKPESFSLPLYWNTDDNKFAGLLRLLYDYGQDPWLDYKIIPERDKDKEKSSVKWSARKQGLGKRALQPIEDCIQNIVEKVTGTRLPAVDLTKLNKPRKKFNSDDDINTTFGGDPDAYGNID